MVLLPFNASQHEFGMYLALGFRQIFMGNKPDYQFILKLAAVAYVVEKLGDLLFEKAPLGGVYVDLKWIQRELDEIQFFLKDADSKQNTDERVRKWVAEIRDVSYEVEDVIDIFIYNQRRRHGFLGPVNRFFSERMARSDVAKQIEQIKLKISEISIRKETYGIIRDVNEGRHEASSARKGLEDRWRFSTSLEEMEVVGQQKEISALIKEQLMNGEPRRCVIPIIGMAGSGKTTLAQKVYHDVIHDFDCHAFICLSRQDENRDILMRIVRSLTGLRLEDMEKEDEDDLWIKIRNRLRRRYLVVIDDISSMKALNMLKLVLPDAMNKSRVMFTTSITEVALHADPSSHPHETRLLDHNESWELFMRKIFPGGNPSTACPSELKDKIHKRCGGLPLAILVLGGLLARKDISAWSEVLDSIPESSQQSKEIDKKDHNLLSSLSKILALSYWDLPHYLKPCFLYLGLFPEAYGIDSRKLIRLWIAEGFIQRRENRIMEDTAEDYLKELVDRSMIQVLWNESNGSIGGCYIHKHLRDLSISKARRNNFFTIHNPDNNCSFSTTVRRLALHCSIDRYHPTMTLRSILSFCNFDISQLEFRKAKLLRVVHQDYEAIFPKVASNKEVGEFVHLRYLSHASGSLVSSFGDLDNLQTIIANRVGSSLPNSISNLGQLRHLEAIAFEDIGNLPVNNLTNLQTLCLREGSWIEDGFGKLTNLRELAIYGSTHKYKALSDSIDKLKNLRSLTLDGWRLPVLMPFTDHLCLYHMSLIGQINKLEELPPNLTELTLEYSLLKQDVISMLEKLPFLKILRLHCNSYHGGILTCTSGGFPKLELLQLVDLPLFQWIVEKGAMPSLKRVVLRLRSNLRIQNLPKRVRVHLLDPYL
ncbi:putative disease resistance protein [Cinnamomum micranthum f. kanehirae]|uniref:Putative disease resistance protein n=1 Tax=Cinnamomum micranthum f. kanehirae TaxID=337451 RepID=A0A3S3NQ33_9MAGN|nr:putative disease resistance protein [Cinnamomum micranthum f. kanehirae]